MSVSELTRNAFHGGISAKKWANLCKLFLANNGVHVATEDVQTDISNSVLVLFRNYPGDPALQGYLKCAIKDGLLTIPKFVTTFLSAAQSPDLHNTATLDMLCRVVLDAHYATGLPALGSIIPYSETPADLLGTVQNSISLLRMAHQLPPSHFHQLVASASELLTLLISCVSPTDISQISTAQAMIYCAEANDILQIQSLLPHVKQELETFALSLSLMLGDDAKAAREAQMMHTLQLAYGKGDIMGTSADTADLVTCGLVLHSFVLNRAGDFGAGDGTHAVAELVALFRWLSWPSTAFFSQLFLAAASCVAQSAGQRSSMTSSLIWRAFVVGRLPIILSMFRKTAESEGLLEGGWHGAIQFGLMNLLRVNILDKCDNIQAFSNGDAGLEKPIHSSPFALEFLHQLVATDVVDASFAATINPTLSNSFTPRITTEARDAGVDVASYLESKLIIDNTDIEEAVSLAERVCRDACSHAEFAAVVYKRFTTLNQPSDVESLSHICKVLCRCEPAVDIVSVHVSLRELLASALAYVEDYDCETVGDPQTAVSYLGEVVLFLQEMVARHNLTRTNASIGDRKLNIDFILPVATVYSMHELKDEAAAEFQAWNKALFDKNSEGIEDSILRNTRPKTLLRITASLFAYAINMCLERKMEKEVLVNGIQYFLGNLLNWTLAGTVKWLLTDVRQKGFSAPIHLDVLQTLLLSPTCPQTVLRLSAPSILRLFPSARKQERSRTGPFDPSPIRRAALQTLGLPVEDVDQPPLSLNTQGNPRVDHATHAIRNALAAARAGKAPALDLDRALLATTPARFLYVLWRELTVAATMGEMEASRRLATFILTTPRHSHSPPLLPIFLHAYLPGIVTAADSLPPSEQAITVELVISVVASALTGALYLERALLTVCNEQNPVLGQSAAGMARNFGSELRSMAHGHNTSSMIVQRLASSPAFVTNFPTFMAEL
ncbi:mediator complex subunit Med5-domain-containing protein [Fomitopsis serialis]|uniref:mediator complex subunit Med5-domain-containing protein n=1 Tax=Fomitopsis serialis TaxID=139415 RepID=UPI0020071F0A|nr:mediator complex subunit Med5-domain-containing protein [Neoantrodia serialis]KAH9937109.1 mediator complex subunit Med5-domain-containing protein [Neoantrodia serialis]